MALDPNYTLTSAEFHRATLLWNDLEMVSEALQDPPCLDVRGKRYVRHGEGLRETPAVRTGIEALALLRSGTDADLLAFAKIVRASVNETLRERAVFELEEEADESRAA